jgi:hypothetical protein
MEFGCVAHLYTRSSIPEDKVGQNVNLLSRFYLVSKIEIICAFMASCSSKNTSLPLS